MRDADVVLPGAAASGNPAYSNTFYVVTLDGNPSCFGSYPPLDLVCRAPAWGGILEQARLAQVSHPSSTVAAMPVLPALLQRHKPFLAGLCISQCKNNKPAECIRYIHGLWPISYWVRQIPEGYWGSSDSTVSEGDRSVLHRRGGNEGNSIAAVACMHVFLS